MSPGNCCSVQEVMDVKEIIDQISQIDAIAFENEQKNKAALSAEKQKYENEIQRYRQERLNAANLEAKAAYEEIIGNAKTEYQVQEEKIKQLSRQLENNYLKAEKSLLEVVFRKLFTV